MPLGIATSQAIFYYVCVVWPLLKLVMHALKSQGQKMTVMKALLTVTLFLLAAGGLYHHLTRPHAPNAYEVLQVHPARLYLSFLNLTAGVDDSLVRCRRSSFQSLMN